MTRLSWSKIAEKPYEAGVSHGVLYPIDTEQEFIDLNGTFHENVEGWTSNGAFGVYNPATLSWDSEFGREEPGSLKVTFNGDTTWANMSFSGYRGKTIHVRAWVYTPPEVLQNPKFDAVFQATTPLFYVSRDHWTLIEWVWTVTSDLVFLGIKWDDTVAGQSVWIDDFSIEVVNQNPGVAWNGLTAVDESYVGADREEFHFDGVKYMDLIGSRHFRAVIRALSTPREFDSCLGYREVVPGFILTRQPKTRFGFSYRTEYGDSNYRIHLVYNAIVTPGAKSYETVSSAQSPTELELTVDAVPPRSKWFRPTAHFIIDSAKTRPDILTQLEGVLYGTDTIDASLPSPERLQGLTGALISEPISEPL